MGSHPSLPTLTKCHIFHPQWTPHAKLHMMWLLFGNCAIALLALYFLWFKNKALLSCILGICIAIGFWMSVATKNLYGGELTDINGIETQLFGLDANVAFFIIISALLAVGIVLSIKTSRQTQNVP